MTEIIIILFYIVSSVVSGFGEAYRIKDVSKYSQLWHDLQWGERVLIFWSGVLTATVDNLLFIIFLGLLFGVIFFIIYDGIINKIAFNREFFYISPTSKAWTEKYASKWIKIPLLVIIFLVNVLFLRKRGD